MMTSTMISLRMKKRKKRANNPDVLNRWGMYSISRLFRLYKRGRARI